MKTIQSIKCIMKSIVSWTKASQLYWKSLTKLPFPLDNRTPPARTSELLLKCSWTSAEFFKLETNIDLNRDWTSCHKIAEVYEHASHPCSKGELRVAVPKDSVSCPSRKGRRWSGLTSSAYPRWAGLGFPHHKETDQREIPKGQGEGRVEKQMIWRHLHFSPTSVHFLLRTWWRRLQENKRTWGSSTPHQPWTAWDMLPLHMAQSQQFVSMAPRLLMQSRAAPTSASLWVSDNFWHVTWTNSFHFQQILFVIPLPAPTAHLCHAGDKK